METGFIFADIYDEVVSRAGGEQSTAEDVIRVRRGMRIVLQRWMNKGYNTWRLSSTSVIAGGYSNIIDLPEDLDDVIEVERDAGGQLTRISPDAYMAITNKMLGGTPGQYWLNRSEPPKLYIHPIGYSTLPTTLTVWHVKTPAHFAPHLNNMDDVPGRWLEALILALSHDLASKRPPYNEALISRLKMDAQEALDDALRADRDRSRYRMRI